MAATESVDPIANAVLSPQASLVVRHILQAALSSNSSTLTNDEKNVVMGLLANVLINDVLNNWNNAGQPEWQLAQNYVSQVLPSTPPAKPDPTLALAYHASGLVKRTAQPPATQPPDPKGALKDFQEAVIQDPNFARGHAQVGNQIALNGDPANSHQYFKNARMLAPNHPAIGYFDWAEGRAYYLEQNWACAVKWLQQSVNELPGVSYNKKYLALAQQHMANTGNQNPR
jgi:tetratricopeptide (TPR) repeat protein